jgi:hypothetical protein
LFVRQTIFILKETNRRWEKVLNYHQEPPLIPAA